MQCPCCNRKRGVKVIDGSVWQCPKCKAIFSNNIWLGESYKYVLPYWDNEENPTEIRYFDFTCVGSEGVTRRHGWYNPNTKRIVQVG